MRRLLLNMNGLSPITFFERLCRDAPRGKVLISDLYLSAVIYNFASVLPYMSK